MKAVKAVYSNGQVQLSEPAPGVGLGPVDVLVVFPESADDPWSQILNEPAPRESFLKFADEAMEEIAQGKTAPLELYRL